MVFGDLEEKVNKYKVSLFGWLRNMRGGVINLFL